MRKSEEAVARRTEAYRKLMVPPQKVMAQAKIFSIARGGSGSKASFHARGQLLIDGLRRSIRKIRSRRARAEAN